MKLQIEALDPLFFRDGRPFALGEESHAGGIFPPLPSTVRGALRSIWISQQLEELQADKEELAKKSASVPLTYFGLGIGGNPVFPAPLDLFFPNIGSFAQPMNLINPNFISSIPSEVTHLFKADVDGKTESIAGNLLDLEAMKSYVNGEVKTGFPTKRLSDFIRKEPKIGIGRDNELHRTKDGLLFRLVTNRFEDIKEGGISFLVETDGFDALKKPLSRYGVSPLGGERKSVTIRSIKFSIPELPTVKGKLFKIYLLTPAFFDSWYPVHLCEENTGLRLVAASIGKPISVGGWDVLKQHPKPMRRAVPAGSVFMFEAENELQANNLAKKYHGKSICKPFDDMDGFGLCFIAQPFDNQII